MSQQYPDERQPNPSRRRRRRKKTKWQLFKERYLPGVIVLAVGAALVIGLIVLLVSLLGGGNDETVPIQTAASTEGTEANAADVLEPAKLLAAQYDYDGAIALLNTFTGQDSRVQAALEEYAEDKADLIVWSDNTKIPHISFQNLIVDTDRAFDGDSAAGGYAKYNLTTEEFLGALEQMYANGYVLVSMTDMADVNDEGKYVAQPIALPAGKKPLIMSLLPIDFTLNKAGDGFARRLMIGEDGTITAEYIDSSATRQYGGYDFVSILEEFIAQNPGFSYRGARAVLGVDNSDEPFGYDLSKPDDVTTLKTLIQCLRDTGYEFASFTYGGVRYGDADAEKVASDVKAWEDAFTGLLGDVNILIYAGGSDLLEYSGDKYDSLYAAGYRYFIGMDNNTEAWGQITDEYVRQTRRTINGTRITEDKKLIDNLFDADKILSDARP